MLPPPLTEDQPCVTGHYFAVGFSPWKRKCLAPFLPEARLSFVRSLRQVPPGASLIVWGRSKDAALRESIGSGHLRKDTPILRVEDGFLRSVGLGASLTKPVSWVFDPVGIYYDPSAPSALELLLQSHPFPDCLLERAQRLINRILELNLTKYNVGNSSWRQPCTTRPIFLVPGQVETDASILLGTQKIRTNLALLEAVRANHPEAFILYKPHPDVLAGLRARGRDEHKTLSVCDAVVTDASMGELLTCVDQVHVMTSLSGFEALLRGKPVVCYGTPFYAGWGLTNDHATVPRRDRNLSLLQLVGAALILYPSYVDPETNQRLDAESAVEVLDRIRKTNEASPVRRGRFLLDMLIRGAVQLKNTVHDRRRSREI